MGEAVVRLGFTRGSDKAFEVEPRRLPGRAVQDLQVQGVAGRLEPGARDEEQVTEKQAEALRLLRTRGDSTIGPGGGVLTSGPSVVFAGTPWINARTAEALVKLGLAKIDGEEITLTEEGLR